MQKQGLLWGIDIELVFSPRFHMHGVRVCNIHACMYVTHLCVVRICACVLCEGLTLMLGIIVDVSFTVLTETVFLSQAYMASYASQRAWASPVFHFQGWNYRQAVMPTGHLCGFRVPDSGLSFMLAE